MSGANSAVLPLSIQSVASSEATPGPTPNLVSDASEALLFDVPMLQSDAARLADVIERSGKQLKTVFISHAHPDHFFASDLIADRFPAARFVSLQNVVADIEADGPWMLSMLQDRLGPEAAKRLVVPAALAAPVLEEGASRLDVVEFGESEAKHMATLHIPELLTLISADLVYHGAHLYLQERHIDGWLAAGPMNSRTLRVAGSTRLGPDMGQQRVST